MRRTANNNIRGQVGNYYGAAGGGTAFIGKGLTSKRLKNVRQHIRKIAFYDVFAFIIIFLGALFKSLSQRSIVFNITIGVTMLLKVLIASWFYNDRHISRLRTYFICRYAYNIFVFCPVMVIMRSITHTYLQNYFLAGGLLFVTEIAIGTFYICNLYKKMPEELFEDIPGIKITQTNTQEYTQTYGSKAATRQHKLRYELKMNIKEAAAYVVYKVLAPGGEKRAEEIVESMRQREERARKQEVRRRMRLMGEQGGEKLAHGIGGKEGKKGQAYLEEDQESEVDLDINYRVQVMRPHEEIELEQIREDLASGKQQSTMVNKFSWQGGQNQRHDKYLAYQPFIAKVVINDVHYIAAHHDNEKKAESYVLYDARSEIERLKGIDIGRYVEKQKKTEHKPVAASAKLTVKQQEQQPKPIQIEQDTHRVMIGRRDSHESNREGTIEIEEESKAGRVIQSIKATTSSKPIESKVAFKQAWSETQNKVSPVNIVKMEVPAKVVANGPKSQKEEQNHDDDSSSEASNYTDQGNIPIPAAKKRGQPQKRKDSKESSSSLSD
ncbi:hypothetical protein FGO68_gene11995 [Halteria grandinella]|uniref:Uncharacterized protein n=1 Tax=Halteria grandinella TaxID=5974 RepID=A0A8J8NRA8_HALGN|nr:hypothetical protein FGO68_gene11995 [Halteria grandinella]